MNLSENLKQIEVFEIVISFWAKKSTQSVVLTQPLINFKLLLDISIKPCKPPIFFAHSNASIKSSMQRSDGVFIVDPSNIELLILLFFFKLNNFGTGQDGL